MNYFEKYTTEYLGTVFVNTTDFFSVADTHNTNEEEYTELIKDRFGRALCNYYDET